MKERPILFSAPMVRAILDSSKTQTRRAVKAKTQNQADILASAIMADLMGEDDGRHEKEAWERIGCPYGQPGDRLWVRETWSEVTSPSRDEDPATFGNKGIIYRADEGNDCKLLKGIWKPSIFMRRWMSRITLEITGIRVERLQDISERDAEAEGISWRHCGCQDGCASCDDRTPQEVYRDLWNSINGPGSWDANPFVWVIEFKKLTNP